MGSLMLRTQMVQHSFEANQIESNITRLTQDVEDDQTKLDELEASLPSKAEEMGMVNKVVPLDKLEDTCVEWAEIMMERSPLALRMIKAGLNAELDGQAGIQELAGDATMLYYTMDEAQEGGKAFLEKRKPEFDKYPVFP